MLAVFWCARAPYFLRASKVEVLLVGGGGGRHPVEVVMAGHGSSGAKRGSRRPAPASPTVSRTPPTQYQWLTFLIIFNCNFERDGYVTYGNVMVYIVTCIFAFNTEWVDIYFSQCDGMFIVSKALGWRVLVTFYSSAFVITTMTFVVVDLF